MWFTLNALLFSFFRLKAVAFKKATVLLYKQDHF